MKTYITNLKNKLSTQTIIIGVSTLIAIIVPVAAFAWGPTDRRLFTEANPADYVTFNSITDNRKWGDERNFMRIRDLDANADFGDVATLQPGRKYEVLILYHNNAKTSLNASGVGVAQGAYARTEMPAIVKGGQSNVKGMAYVGASNANPTAVYDHIDLNNNTNNDIAMRYIKGTAKMYSNGAVDGAAVSESIFSTGSPLGYDALNGVLPGCDEFSGYIKFTMVADSPDFTFAKDVRLAGTKDWKDDVTVNKGDKVEYRLSYKNTGTVEQTDVVMKDVLPKGITYLTGQTDLINSLVPNGKRMGDGIYGGGVNIGNYNPGANAFLYFFATIDGNPCEVLVNKAAIETDNGNREDTATVRINGSCAKPVEELPTTGPVEVIAGLIGIAAITIGVMYYMKSRRDLEDALRNAQTHPTMTKVDDLTTGPVNKK